MALLNQGFYLFISIRMILFGRTRFIRFHKIDLFLFLLFYTN